MSLYKWHALLQVIAFLILLPIGVIIAILRNYIGPGWHWWHVTIQFVATIMIFTAIVLVKIAERMYTQKEDDDKKVTRETNKYIKWHKIVGPIVVSLIILQWIWAYFGIKIVGSFNIWLTIHAIIAFLILPLGWLQVYLGYKMHN